MHYPGGAPRCSSPQKHLTDASKVSGQAWGWVKGPFIGHRRDLSHNRTSRGSVASDEIL